MTPENLRACRAQVRALRIEIKSIETQLGDKDRTHPDGRRLTDRQYAAWRKNAMKAMLAKLTELKAQREWQAAAFAKLRADSIDVDTGDPESMLRASYLAHELVKESFGHEAIPEGALKIFDIVRDHVMGLD